MGGATAGSEICLNENYIFIKKIGVGGFSTVYEVRNKSNGKIYAMKVLSRSSLEGKDKMRQVIVEKQIIEQLNHPFIVKSYSVFSSVSLINRNIPSTSSWISALVENYSIISKE